MLVKCEEFVLKGLIVFIQVLVVLVVLFEVKVEEKFGLFVVFGNWLSKLFSSEEEVFKLELKKGCNSGQNNCKCQNDKCCNLCNNKNCCKNINDKVIDVLEKDNKNEFIGNSKLCQDCNECNNCGCNCFCKLQLDKVVENINVVEVIVQINELEQFIEKKRVVKECCQCCNMKGSV